ncbi:geranylgeranyl reductase family protein [candidate division KSB3 bacterium]|uniref:Geranylgeranyl reductase family protein n=1 Tax=candidate division KSB3 bacterium TaxID=2044937 RepID=A0A9D5JTN3_9BACT|nr:geranylgeranyl reductase family protein [candidate division KSB3 bacterium]MBD3323796.1 geranylgeranyl reductase family protein [candidate division KSB3 bacterium]
MRDAVIVGAGPAGSTAAALLAAHGYDVLLVDKQTFPREKVCGDIISPKTQWLLQQIGLLEMFPLHQYQAIATVRVFAPDGSSFTGKLAPDDGLYGGSLIIPRKEFDHMLKAFACARGAECLEQCAIHHLTYAENDAVMLQGYWRGERFDETTRVVLAADGVHSRLAKTVHLPRKSRHAMMTSIRGYYQDVKGLDQQIRLYYDRVRPFIQFGWVIPVSATCANIGYSTSLEAIRRQPIQRYFAEFLASPKLIRHVRQAKLIGRLQGCSLALGTVPLHRVARNVLFLGDAARLIDPITGEGISNAITSAMIAADVIHACFGSPANIRARPSAEIMHDFSQYADRCKQAFGEEFRQGWKLRRVLQTSNGLTNFAIRRLAARQSAADTVVRMLGEVVPKGDLCSWKFLTKLVW